MRLLVVSDGRRGIENQALGLAEAVSQQTDAPCDIIRHRLSSGRLFTALPPQLQHRVRQDFNLPEADLVIGCGRQAIAPLIALRKRQPGAFTCYVQHPRINTSHFDLVIAPDHDGLTGPNVETMIGSPNRVTPDRITADMKGHADRLAALPAPRAMIAMGGPSRTHELGDQAIAVHLEAARQLVSQGYSLLMTTSRRTPEAVLTRWREFAEQADHVWFHTPMSEGDNPYFAFLGAADIILVTEDSTNMLTEACATGKPVFRLPMTGDPGKFAKLYDALEARCHVRPWDGTGQSEAYLPLDETGRVAKRLLERFRSRP